jgi:TonB family protein
MDGDVMKKTLPVLIVLAIVLILSTQVFSIELPRFYGIYVLQCGKYVEVPRISNRQDFITTKYNIKKRMLGNSDYNIQAALSINYFISTSKADFDRDGFLVVKDEEWSDIKLFRVPHRGRFAQNEQGNNIVTSIGVAGSMMGMIESMSGLEKEVKPIEIKLRKAKIGEEAYIFVPAVPIEPGCYLIDYQKKNQAHFGWNPIKVESLKIESFLENNKQFTDDDLDQIYEKLNTLKAISNGSKKLNNSILKNLMGTPPETRNEFIVPKHVITDMERQFQTNIFMDLCGVVYSEFSNDYLIVGIKVRAKERKSNITGFLAPTFIKRYNTNEWFLKHIGSTRSQLLNQRKGVKINDKKPKSIIKSQWAQSGYYKYFYEKGDIPCITVPTSYKDSYGQEFVVGCSAVAVGQLINYYLSIGYRKGWLEVMLKDTKVYPRFGISGSFFYKDCIYPGLATKGKYPNSITDWKDKKANELREFLWAVSLGLGSHFSGKGDSAGVGAEFKLFKKFKSYEEKLKTLLIDRFRFSPKLSYTRTVKRLDNVKDIIINSIDKKQPLLIEFKNKHLAIIDAYRFTHKGDFEVGINFGWGNKINSNELWYSGTGPIKIPGKTEVWSNFVVFYNIIPDTYHNVTFNFGINKPTLVQEKQAVKRKYKPIDFYKIDLGSQIEQNWVSNDNLKSLEVARKNLEKKIGDQNKNAIAEALSRLEKKKQDRGTTKQKGKVSAGVGEKGYKPIDRYKMVLGSEIEQNWVFNDILAGLDQNLEVRILIKILKSGEIRDIIYETKSGNRYLDESAKKAIKKTNPLPPLPPGMRSYDVVVIFTPRGLLGSKQNHFSNTYNPDQADEDNNGISDVYDQSKTNNAQFDTIAQQIKTEIELFKKEFNARLLELSDDDQKIGELRKNLSLMDKIFRNLESENAYQAIVDKQIKQLENDLNNLVNTHDSRIETLHQKLIAFISRLYKTIDQLSNRNGIGDVYDQSKTNNTQFDTIAQQIKTEIELFKKEFNARLLELSDDNQKIGELRKNLNFMDKIFRNLESENAYQAIVDKQIKQLENDLNNFVNTHDSRIETLNQKFVANILRLQKNIDHLSNRF